MAGDCRRRSVTVGDSRGLLKMWAAEAMIHSEDFTQWSEIT